MINHFKIIYSGLIAIIVAAIFGIGVYVLTITNNKLTIILIFVGIFLIDSLMGIYIINSKRNINTRACWILALVYLPLIGIILFLIFGIKSLSEKTLQQHREDMNKYSQYENFEYTDEILNEQKNSIFWYGYISALRPVYKDNNFTIIPNNQDLYEQTINLIRSAKKIIHIQIYMINDGFYLRTVFAELIKKARQGIKIRFLYDWYGSYHKFKNRMLRELKKNNIEIATFNPKGINMFKGLTNYRSHKKAIIIDNHIALYGSYNFGDEYLNMNGNCANWKDLNFIVKGEVVNTINLGFCHDWISYTSYSLSKQNKTSLIKTMKSNLSIKKDLTYPTNIQMLFNSPLLVERNISDITIKLILTAKKSIRISTPYFLPTSEVMQAIRIAIKSGINVELMVPGKRDNKDFILTMNRNSYKELLELGCCIYEYNGFIHSKYLIIDDNFVLTGSNNFDFRSFIINFENGLLIDNQKIANQMIKVFEKDKLNAHEFTITDIIPIVTSIKHRWNILLLNLYKPIF